MPIQTARGDIAGRLIRLFRGKGNFPLQLDETAVPVVVIEDLSKNVDDPPGQEASILSWITSNTVGSAGNHPMVALRNPNSIVAYDRVTVAVDFALSGSTEANIFLVAFQSTAGIGHTNKQRWADLRLQKLGRDVPPILGQRTSLSGLPTETAAVFRLTPQSDSLTLDVPPLISRPDNFWAIVTGDPDEALLVTVSARLLPAGSQHGP